MTGAPEERRFPWALLASLLLHTALLAWWRGAPPSAPRAAPSDMLEVRLLPLAPPVAPAPAPPEPRVRRKPDRPVAAQPAPASAAASVPASPKAPSAAVALPAPPRAEAEEAEPAGPSLTEQARAMAGATDQALRKEHPERKGLFTLPVNTPMARFIRALEAAGQPRATSTVTIRTAEGQTITKVITSRGSYCVYGRKARPNAATFGTAFDTNYTTGTCPE